MPRLNIVPSPCPEVVVAPYDEALFPKFQQIFETPAASSPLLFFHRDAEEAALAVVLENQSEKAITGLRYRWRFLDRSGKVRNHTASSDSYFLDKFRAVAQPGSRHLLSQSGALDEAMLDYVLAGGSLAGGKTSGSTTPLAEVVEVTFEIDLVVFADGEISGPDPNRYAAELQCRKRAAEFVAGQIRLATAEGRDVTPVLSALAEVPCLGRVGQGQRDPLVHWTRRFAQQYLRRVQLKIGNVDMREAGLRHLENQPVLPKFYRRAQ